MKVEEMFEKYNLPWNNLLSVLLDSCNTMRGKKSGLEARIREKAPHLLDIDGDSVHHVHNAAKAFTTPFKYYLESLFNCLHSDFHWSTDLRNELKLICEILNIKFTVPERFTSHRFLSAYNLAVDTDRLLDAYTIFYTAFLKTGEQKKFQYLYEIILEKRGVSETSKEELLKIRKRLSKKKMTKDGQERKENVLLKLFDERKKTRMLLGVYIASLHSLKEYATLFQSKAPMVHVLHDEQVRLVREFLCFFVKPECIPQSVKNLKLLEFTEDTLLPKRDMFIGSNAQRIVMKSKAKDYMVTEVLESIRTAYVKSGSVLLRKMPIDNEFLQCLSAIDPAARGHSMTLKLLKRLPFHVSHVLSEKEEECYMREIHRYQADPTLPVPKAETRVDHWWACRNDYPMMRKLMLALLTCFHGPMVEGVFNVMGDVMDTKSSSLGVDSLNAIQNVKSALKAKELSSVEYFGREDTLYTPVVPGLTACTRTAGKQRNLELTKKRCEKDQQCEKLGISDKKVVTKKAAQELMSDNIKRARIVFQEKNGN
ncbi:uncharacterized protein LOC123549557 [Mercenaria mercenaria]|uniref:uncharacterized protein LOC123549557 n=1 Tax=Mercenaria mercenaria TaxID=6596 RepID=UPI00234FB4A1|nr:uncharacterized protein LOC123549557 [Mercenaria mercenaria]